MNKGIRIANLIVDMFIIAFTSAIVSAFMSFTSSQFIMAIVMFTYYFLFEATTGQTIGKKITKTVVVDLNNKKPNLIKVFLRTLMRFNPIDNYSYLYGAEQGSHDILSRTRLKFKE